MIRIRVAGCTLALDSSRVLPSPLGRFRVRSGADCRIAVREGEPEGPSGALLFDSGGLWKVFERGRQFLYVFSEPGRAPYASLAIDRSWTRGTLVRRRSKRPDLDYPLDELLFQHHVTLRQGFELHASGILVGHRAVLFSGHSGAGKTTLVSLWKQRRRGTLVLSDDRVIVRKRGRVFWAWGTPWHGSGRFASAEGRRLGAIFFIRHASGTSERRLTPIEAASKLYARSFPPVFDRRALARVLQSCTEIAESVPCYDLGVTPDRSVVDAVERLVRDR